MPQILLKLTIFLILTSLFACKEDVNTQVNSDAATFKELRQGISGDPLESVRRFNLVHSSGRMVKTILLVSARQQEVGLSGTKDHEFADNEAALFWYPESSVKRFWMPDTYFNLDIIFLDDDLKIIEIDRNVEAHPGRQEPPPIALSKMVNARHVLEVRAKSPISEVLKIGDRFEVLQPLSLSKIESEIRRQQ